MTDDLDTPSDEIVRFGRDGRPLRVYGRKGSGPGELLSPGFPMFFWNSLLATGDRGGSVSFFRIDDGKFVGSTEPRYLFPLPTEYVTEPRLQIRTATAVADFEEQRPMHAWRGDTLFVASTELRGSAAATRIQGFTVAAEGCEWIPVG